MSVEEKGEEWKQGNSFTNSQVPDRRDFSKNQKSIRWWALWKEEAQEMLLLQELNVSHDAAMRKDE